MASHPTFCRSSNRSVCAEVIIGGLLVLLTITGVGCMPVAALPVRDRHSRQQLTLVTRQEELNPEEAAIGEEGKLVFKQGSATDQQVHADGYIVWWSHDRFFAYFPESQYDNGHLLEVHDGKVIFPEHWWVQFWALHWFVWGDRCSWIIPRLGPAYEHVITIGTFIPGYKSEQGSLPDDGILHLQTYKDPQNAKELWQEHFVVTRSSANPGPSRLGRQVVLLDPDDYKKLKQCIDAELARMDESSPPPAENGEDQETQKNEQRYYDVSNPESTYRSVLEAIDIQDVDGIFNMIDPRMRVYAPRDNFITHAIIALQRSELARQRSAKHMPCEPHPPLAIAAPTSDRIEVDHRKEHGKEDADVWWLDAKGRRAGSERFIRRGKVWYWQPKPKYDAWDYLIYDVNEPDSE